MGRRGQAAGGRRNPSNEDPSHSLSPESISEDETLLQESAMVGQIGYEETLWPKNVVV